MTCEHPQCNECFEEYKRVWDHADDIYKQREVYRRACQDLDMLHRRRQARVTSGKDTKDIDCHLERIRRVAGIHAGPLRDAPKLEERCDCFYYCPTSKEYECSIHGGFSVCCSHPEKHIDFKPRPTT